MRYSRSPTHYRDPALWPNPRFRGRGAAMISCFEFGVTRAPELFR